jgi:Tfp pilus assembly protein PilV
MRFILAVLFVVAAAAQADAMDQSKAAEVRDRINKAWDERLDKMWLARTQAACKAEAKKKYSAIRFRKRRAFVKDCIEQAHR